MGKYLFLLLLGILPFIMFAQQKPTLIILKGAERVEIRDDLGLTYLRKPTFLHENAIMTCDSAVLYQVKNYFEAYDNVHINQADTVNIYSQRLTYDGNTKKAHLSDKVRMLHKDAVLTTNILDYDMVAKIGQYTDKGRIVNKDIKIDSKNGYYFASTRDAYFRYNVVAVTERAVIKSDTLRYNTISNLTYFYGPTNITGKDDNLYTENGTYNTKTEDAWFGKKNLYTNGSRSLKGDSLYYNGKLGYGKATKNIVFIDTNDKTKLYGQLGEYFKADEKVVVTRNAWFVMATNDSVMVKDVKTPDSLFLGADTLETRMVLQSALKLIKPPFDMGVMGKAKKPAAKPGTLAVLPGDKKEAKKPVTKDAKAITPKKPADSLVAKQASAKVTDSLKAKADTIGTPPDTLKTRIIKAFHNVKVYKGNLQARADSLFYTNADSTLRWYRNPIIWAEGSQQVGDTIYVQFKNKKLSSAQVIRNGFIVNIETDTTKFNQIKGKLITSFFKDGELKTMHADGNAESIYYNKEGNVYKDMHQNIAGRITFHFDKKEVVGFNEVLGFEGATTPIAELTGENKLTGFSWKPELRPTSKEDVIGKPYVKPAPVKKPAPKKVVTPPVKVAEKKKVK